MVSGKIGLTLLENFKDVGLTQKRNDFVIVGHWNHVLVLRPADGIECAGRSGKNGWSRVPRVFTYLASTVAALPGQVLPMNQRARGSAALKWEPRVDERGGPGVVVDKKRLALMVMLHLPAPR